MNYMNMEENKYMFFTEKKAHARINELFEYRYRDRINLSEWQFAEDDGALGNYPPKQSPSHAKEVVIGDRWEDRDLYAWLSKEVTLPQDWPSNKSIVDDFDFGDTGACNISGFVSLLFLNGSPYQGVDTKHKEVFFPAEIRGKKVNVDFRLWSAMEGGG